MASAVAGVGWHIVGAAMAASFYAPIERVRKWSWEGMFTMFAISMIKLRGTEGAKADD